MDDFRELCRRNLKRSVAHRIKYGFVRDESYPDNLRESRAFTTMQEYREWCHRKLPEHLGYKIIGRDGYTLENSTYKPLEWKGDVDESKE